MDVGSMPFLLVTANVGSVFEDPSRLLKTWIKQFLSKVALLKPQFLALHLQEVGGKTYDKSMEYVQEFIKTLCESDELAEYNRIRIYLDEDYNSAEHFTALGNLYFIHQKLQTVKIWNFLTHEWECAEGKNINTGNIETIPTKEKAKFPQHFFPECKWSRKGFLRTRWELNCTVVDFINIHLFHDASNLAACEEFPSVYCRTRRRALVHTLERFHTDAKNGVAPYFVFGDFNFRCDTGGVIKKLTEDLTAHRIQNAKNDSTKLQYRNSDGINVLTVGKKEFNHADHQTKFKESWVQQFDRELEPLREILVEYPITFPPSYPYEEDPDMPMHYMFTRCPAWCDRIVMSPLARDLTVDETFSSTDYNIIGENVCMGDHKPVYLSIHVKAFQGTVRCCHCYEHASQPNIYDLKHFDVNDFVKKNAYCLYSSLEFNKILLECRKLNNYISQDAFIIENNDRRRKSDQLNDTITITSDAGNNSSSIMMKPLISINITDPDSLNICLCSSIYNNENNHLQNVSNCNNSSSKYDVDDNGKENQQSSSLSSLNDGTICPQCRNIIKMQSTDHRRTLFSNRLLLNDSIIVNRIDTHYLNTYNRDNKQEPYTPESAESRSPCPEMEISESQDELFLNDDNNGNNDNDDNDDDDNNKESNILSQLCDGKTNSNNKTSSTLNKTLLNESISRGIVSPRQLKSRLETLQRTSLCSEMEEFEHNKFKSKSCKKCCSIM